MLPTLSKITISKYDSSIYGLCITEEFFLRRVRVRMWLLESEIEKILMS
jgi:hypothetical protein